MELKPCPFCGQVPITWNAVNDLGKSDTWIECNNNDCTHRDDLISLTDWQSRPIEDALKAENDELREALKESMEYFNEYMTSEVYDRLTAILAKQEGK